MTGIKGVLAGALSIGAVFCATAAQAEAVKLKAAAFLPERVVLAKYFYQWARETNKRCAGKVEIGVVGPAAIPSLEQWNALKTGVIDMYFGPANYYKGAVPAGDVFVVAHVPPAEQRKNGAWKAINELHNKKLNAWYLTVVNYGVPFYIYTSKAAKGGKLQGFRIRSVPLYDGLLKRLGANPVRMSATQVYTAMERGTVDGFGWPSWGISAFGFQKLTKFYYGPGFFSAASPILVNLDRWKGLSADQRTCLSASAAWLEQVWPQWLAQEDKNQKAILDKSGIKYGKLDAKIMQDVENAYWDGLAKANPAFIKTVRPLLTK